MNFDSWARALTTASIWDGIEDFMRGFDALKTQKPKDDAYIFTSRINKAVDMLEAKPGSLDMLPVINQNWSDLADLERFNAISSVDIRTRQIMTMFGTWSPYAWLTKTITDAMSTLERVIYQSYASKSWIEKLVTDVYNAVTNRGDQKQKHRKQTFHPNRYLPSSTLGSITVNLGRFTLLADKNNKTTFQICWFLLKAWLKFPSTLLLEYRYVVVDCFMKCSPSNSFLLLTDAWKLFSEPTSYIDKNKDGLSGSMDLFIEPLELRRRLLSVLNHHPIFVEGSPGHSCLATLDYLLQLWYDKNGPAHQPWRSSKSTSQRYKPTSTNTPLGSDTPHNPDISPPLPNLTNAGLMVFHLWLQKILPVLKKQITSDGSIEIVVQADKLQLAHAKDLAIKKICLNPDFHLPFRECAPTRQKVKRTVYGNKDTLRTADGFWTVLAHRGVFYGSSFERESNVYFKSYVEWQRLRSVIDKPDSYFTNMGAYGSAISQRTLNRLPEYRDDCGAWMEFLERQEDGELLSMKSVYDFLTSSRPNINEGKALFQDHHNRKQSRQSTRYNEHGAEIDDRKSVPLFFGIGPLIALLICGDLVMAGLIRMPSKQEMGFLIADVGKGAKAGLEKLGLIGPSASKTDICNAFVAVCDYLEEHFTTDEKNLIGYNVVMVEHGLCKYSRLTPWKNKKNKKKRSK